MWPHQKWEPKTQNKARFSLSFAMTAQTPEDSPEAPEIARVWLSVNEAAAACGVSTKTLRRRMAAGAVNFRRVTLARGGAAYEVEMDSVLDSSKPMFQTGVQTDRKMSKPTSHKGYISSGVLNVKSPILGTGLEVEMDISKTVSKPMPEMSKPVSISSERETELKEEISFLRGIVESDRRDMAELRAALREALKAMPKQLTAGSAAGEIQTAPESPISSDKPRGVATPRAASNEAQNGDVSSYSSIADWLENEILGR
jgi:hypothetical protein